MSGRLPDRQVRRLAVVTGGAMGGALVVASLVGFAPQAAADASVPVASMESTEAAPSTSLLFMARGAVSPCEAATGEYRAAQAALAAGDIDAADDLAVIAQALLEECGWTRTDAALGGRHGDR